MNKEKWQELEKKEYAFLDSLDIGSIIYDNQEISAGNIMRIIENKYEDEYLKQNPEDECLFNVIDTYDFAVYIWKRYGIKAREETKYYFDV